jgi:xanthine dioxygenase
VWKNPITGDLHLQVNPSVLLELIIAPIPASKRADADGDAIFPDGAHITDLAAARELVYKLQRPSISPEVSLTVIDAISHSYGGTNLKTGTCSSSILMPGEFTDIVQSIICICRLTHSWRSEKDLILFHNRGLLHSAVGTLRRDQIRVFHQVPSISHSRHTKDVSRADYSEIA